MASRLLTSPTVAGSLILYARLKAGLSQRELAKRLGAAQSVVAAYETGRRDPTVRMLIRILAGAGFDLRLGISGHEDHDDVLDALERQRPAKEQERWRRSQQKVVKSARKQLGVTA